MTTYLKEEVDDEALARDLPAFTKFLDLAGCENGNLINDILEVMKAVAYRRTETEVSFFRTSGGAEVDRVCGRTVRGTDGRAPARSRQHRKARMMRTQTRRCLTCCTSMLLSLAWIPPSQGQTQGLVLHVSTAGNDAWSGRPAAPNPAGTDGPLASLGRAQERIREIKAVAAGGPQAPVTVLLRGGTYRQAKPLVFTAADSGSQDAPITFAAYPGENPIISGGTLITGWTLDDSLQSRTRCAGKLWRVDLPKAAGRAWSFNQLFVNEQRRTRARIPNRREFLRTDGPVSKGERRAFYFKEGDLKAWENLDDVIVVVYHSWETSIHHLQTVDSEARLVTLREPAPWAMGNWEKQQRYYVENVFEGLDEPGERYLNQATGRLYYYPLPGETMADVEACAPVLTSSLIQFQGEPVKGAFVEYLHFRGISFQHTNSQLRRVRNPGQGEIFQPGLIQAVGLRQASFVDCDIAHTGAHGIWLAEGCTDVRLERCHIHDLGGGGVYIGGGWGINEAAPTERITVDNCFIHDGSYLFRGAHGVWIGRSSYNTVTHNEISNFDYSGISCGWSWGFQPSSAHHNTLDYNYIHHLGNGDGLGDMGGIYTLGISPGTTERYNHIHDVFNYAPVSHGSGIYPDEGSSEILIENNVVYRVRTCPLFQHYGKDNTIRNNIFALGGKGQLQRCREDIPCHYAAVGNLVYADLPQMLGGVWKDGNWKLERNLYWSTAGAPVFAGLDFAAWQAKGNDAGSVVADPLFVNPQAGNFRLQPNSPALALGFQDIDLSPTGLYGEPAWVNLPGQYPNRTLLEVPPPVETPLIINFGFETDEPGAEPLDGEIIKGENGAALQVSTETAAASTRSLKFTDAPEQKNNWTPHVYYRKTYTRGKVQLSWDMLNRQDAPASFYVELRQYEGSPYVVGPTVSVAPDGKVTASNQEVGTMPLGEWVRVEIAIELGEGAPPTYQLALRVPGREPVLKELPYLNRSFRQIEWLGISSTSVAATVFYIDNLKLGTAEDLATPPPPRPPKRPLATRPPLPANPQALAGYWSFDEGDGYTAKDLSGCGNDADVGAGWATGTFGAALLCDPVAHSATIKDDPTLRFGTTDFSLELWLCPTTLTIDSKDPRRRFMSKNAYPTTWWNLNLTPEGKPFLEMVDANKVGCTNRPAGVIPPNAWTHFVVVVERANAKTRYYFNGALDSAQDIPAAFTGALDVEGGDLSIGSSWQPFIGLLNEVKIYRRALAPAEIKASYEKDQGKHSSVAYEAVE